MVFPVSSIGAGLAAARRGEDPGRHLGRRPRRQVIATNGSGGPMALPIVEMMVEDLGGKGRCSPSPTAPAKSAGTAKW